MYHTVFKQRLRKAFDHLNQGDYPFILSQFSPQFEHVFPGQHALSGTRTTPESNEKWYKRLYQIFPDLHFDLKNIDITGFPWDTTASVEWDDHFTGPDGKRYGNQGVHVFRFKWARVTSLHIYTDTQKLTSICEHFAQLGRAEAGAMPIVD